MKREGDGYRSLEMLIDRREVIRLFLVVFGVGGVLLYLLNLGK